MMTQTPNHLLKALYGLLLLLVSTTIACDRFENEVTTTRTEAFRKVYGGFDLQQAAAILPGANGGFVLLSTSNSFNEVSNDRYEQMYLIFTNDQGDEIRLEGDQDWIFGATDVNTTANTFVRKNDGFLLLGEQTIAPGNPITQLRLFQTDANGDSVGSPPLTPPPGFINIRAGGIVPSGTGGFLIAGYGIFSSRGDTDVVLFKIDGAGNPTGFLSTSLGFDGTNESAVAVVSVDTVNNSEFAVLANTIQNGISRMVVFLVNDEGQRVGEEIMQDKFLDVSLNGQDTIGGQPVNLNASGQVANDLVYDGVRFTLLGSDVETGRALVLNLVRSGNTLQPAGGVLHAKQSNERIVGSDLVPINGGLLLVGSVTGLGAGGSNIFVNRIDASGNPVGGNWPVTFGGEGEDEGVSALQTDDGGFAIYGHVAIEGDNTLLTLIKTNSSGVVEQLAEE